MCGPKEGGERDWGRRIGRNRRDPQDEGGKRGRRGVAKETKGRGGKPSSHVAECMGEGVEEEG